MRFVATGWHGGAELTPRTVYLQHVDWDDWFKFATTYSVLYVDRHGERHSIGTTKIGKFGLKPAGRGGGIAGEMRFPGPPDSFTELPATHFSLAQDPSFYETLSQLGSDVRDSVLSGLRDLAYSPSVLERAQHEEVTRVSLLRNVPLLTVQEQYARLAQGGARLTPYNLRYTLSYLKSKPTIGFSVTPNSFPPSNIHVVIGRNGVGKSTFLNNLASFHVKRGAGDPERSLAEDAVVANLVSVSFSAFDAFEPLTSSQDRTKGLTYHYVGLKIKDDAERIKGPKAIASEMTKSARACLQDTLRGRWVRALRLLESDPIFASVGIADAVEDRPTDAEFLEELPSLFKRLSSGHKIVLLTVTRLVETVAEKSLVLLDEPEAHLHPPLLSAFVRALSDLLIDRNGLAIIATHSPVVLQEVPRDCVWKFNRVGDLTSVERPLIETFGENVGTLTNEVFALEVTSTGYHQILLEVATEYAGQGYESALAKLDGKLGSEGKAILRAMIDALRARDHVGS
ncbi:AAA family ATPase [Microbacterium sp. M3]|uniref:AAA family ATPase n=1 Tax=Microbacterium arthrosphaerae TaxID=792652 RepID=A0ABU4GZU8_9MICO|nr:MULTISPECIES: AAA family ATPase [Microbacterium]MDW4572612.1 AAA family ATPase [Microbacterium arthrosphaerae]MDW7606467.1 AAA family ATPase [Microbacterium sp. M3]